ncbi:MAG: hypothetical protein P4L42_16750 [Desulfocapsaceae bacterium]|nr:hypothetical protein [Desulfocapsaceae bacterium]
MKALQKLSSCHTEVMRFHKVSRQVNLARPCWFKEGPPVNESDFSKVR